MLLVSENVWPISKGTYEWKPLRIRPPRHYLLMSLTQRFYPFLRAHGVRTPLPSLGTLTKRLPSFLNGDGDSDWRRTSRRFSNFCSFSATDVLAAGWATASSTHFYPEHLHKLAELILCSRGAPGRALQVRRSPKIGSVNQNLYMITCEQRKTPVCNTMLRFKSPVRKRKYQKRW